MRGNLGETDAVRGCARRAFSLPELLVVIGVIALLVALLLPPLQLAKAQAMQLQCAARLQQLGLALEECKTEFDFYPLWDDGTDRVRYTWIDVLIQRRLIADYRAGYCPMDMLPDAFNRARGQAFQTEYPGEKIAGVDYSFGIGVPLAAGGWRWREGYGRNGDNAPRRFDGHERFPSGRVLAGDANWSSIYNLNGRALETGVWNDPSWYDNTVAWRHNGLSANLLFQDGHVDRVAYRRAADSPVNTSLRFVWYPGEPVGVGPDSVHDGFYYPDTPPPYFGSTPKGDVFPNELVPVYYTDKSAWTLIQHK